MSDELGELAYIVRDAIVRKHVSVEEREAAVAALGLIVARAVEAETELTKMRGLLSVPIRPDEEDPDG